MRCVRRYEFSTRTKDNVELQLGVTFYWGIASVEQLVGTTSDPPGDVCSHARSTIIQAISQMSLEDFLANFNKVVSNAIFAAPLPTAQQVSGRSVVVGAAAPAPAPAAAAAGHGHVAATAITQSHAQSGFPYGKSGGDGVGGDGGGFRRKNSTGNETNETASPPLAHAHATAKGMAIKGMATATEGMERMERMEGVEGMAAQGMAVDSFYTDRGLSIQGIEVRSIACKDHDTQRILQEIIKENTNRISRLQHQESANEVTLRKLQGEIDNERMRGKLVDIQQELASKEGQLVGRQEASRVRAFMTGLSTMKAEGMDEELTVEQRLQIFSTLRKGEALKNLSQSNGKCSMYFTPNDVDLKLSG